MNSVWVGKKYPRIDRPTYKIFCSVTVIIFTVKTCLLKTMQNNIPQTPFRGLRKTGDKDSTNKYITQSRAQVNFILQ